MGIFYKSIRWVVLAIIDYIFPKLASKIVLFYWMTTSKTHSDLSMSNYEFYFNEILKLMKPNPDDRILDAACGTGEITYLFFKNGFDIKGFDFSDYLICKAKLRFPEVNFYVDNLVEIKNVETKFDKIFANNAIFYVHPRYLKRVIQNLSNLLNENGELCILDWPDFEKRKKWRRDPLYILFTRLVPVYQPDASGFWYKRK